MILLIEPFRGKKRQTRPSWSGQDLNCEIKLPFKKIKGQLGWQLTRKRMPARANDKWKMLPSPGEKPSANGILRGRGRSGRKGMGAWSRLLRPGQSWVVVLVVVVVAGWSGEWVTPSSSIASDPVPLRPSLARPGSAPQSSLRKLEGRRSLLSPRSAGRCRSLLSLQWAGRCSPSGAR